MLPVALERVGDGRLLRVARLGAGPPVVLLHGYPENLQIWCRVAPLLAQQHRVIAFDWPGLGGSEAWRGGATPRHQADRLRTLLDEWAIPRAAVVGLDMGGQPALVFAAAYPERCSALVVSNSLVLPDAVTSWEIRVLRRFGWNRFVLRRLPGAVFFRAEHTFLPPGVRLSPELRRDFWERFRRPEVRRFLIRMCAGYQGTLDRLPDLYPGIRVPSLVLWGERDRHFPLVHARRLHAAIPDSQLEVIPGGEHWMPWHAAPQVAAALRSFLAPAPVTQSRAAGAGRSAG